MPDVMRRPTPRAIRGRKPAENAAREVATALYRKAIKQVMEKEKLVEKHQ